MYDCVSSLDLVPKLALVQNAATGVERILKSPIFANASEEELGRLDFANCAGNYVGVFETWASWILAEVHLKSLNIGGFVLNYVTGLYNLIPQQIRWQAVSCKEMHWADLSS